MGEGRVPPPTRRRGRNSRGVQCLAVLLLVGLVVRLPGLRSMPLWIDETFTLGYARSSVDWILGASRTLHPPAYPLSAYLALRLWPESAWVVRLPALLGGLTCVLAVFTALRALGRSRAALFGAGLLCTSVYAVYYSQEARGYSCAAAATGLAYAFALQHHAAPSARRLAAVLLFVLVACSFHYMAVAPTGALVVTLVLQAALSLRRRGLGRSSLLLWVLFGGASIGILVLLAPRVATLASFVTNDAQVRVRPGILLLHAVVSRWIGAGPQAGWVALVLGVVGLVDACRRSAFQGALLGTWIASPFLLVALVPTQKFFEMRYVMTGIVPAFVLVPAGLAVIGGGTGALGSARRTVASLVGACLLAGQLPVLVSHAGNPEKQFPRFHASSFGLRHISLHSSIHPWMMVSRTGNDFHVRMTRVGNLLCPEPGDRWRRGTRRGPYDPFVPLPGVTPEGVNLACVWFDSVQQYERIEVRFYHPEAHASPDLSLRLADSPYRVETTRRELRGGVEVAELRRFFLRGSERPIGLFQLSWDCVKGHRVDVTVVSSRVGQAVHFLEVFARRGRCHRFADFGQALSTGSSADAGR